MRSQQRKFNRTQPSSTNSSQVAVSDAAGPCALPMNEQALIREFMQALAEEIEAIKKGRGGSIITVYDGVFVRRDGPFFVYVFTTESPLIVMDDAPADVKIGGQTFRGQIVSVQGSEVAVAIENNFGKSIAEARLITNLWYLLEALRKHYEEVLNGQRTLETRLGQRLFGFVPINARTDDGELNLPASPRPPNGEQLAAIRAACGSDVHFIWGPPGTGKTETIGFLIAALLRRNLRVLVVSHTNVATDHAIQSVAQLLLDSEDYQNGKLVRFGNRSQNVVLPEMVIPEKIVAVLGQQLRERLAKLQADLGSIQSVLTSLHEAEALLDRQKEALQRLGQLESDFRRCAQEIEQAKSQARVLSNRLQETKTKLAEARIAGTLKRFFTGLDPVKLQTQIAKLETDLATVQRRIEEGTSKLDAIRAAKDAARREQESLEQQVHNLLSRMRLRAEELPSRVSQLSKQAEELTAAIRTIEAELEALLAKILREAKLIATSLTKATISKEFDGQKFDVLVMDEASMAPMPSLYFAAGRAARKAIVVGDFRQLPPICVADKKEMAQKWLGRDIFNQAGIQRAVDEGKPEPRLTMLRRQYRMHPEISKIANEIIYSGQLVDCLNRDSLQGIDTFLRGSPLAQTPLVLYDVSSTNPWSSHLEQGGRYNLYSAVLSAEIAKRAAQAGIESIGVISPYSVHARLIKMILDDSGDPKLRHLKVSTVHRFQGLEQEAIIFDVAEGPMPRYGPSRLVDGTELASQAAKLINVSITRPKAQIAIVANCDYLSSKLQRDAILLRVLEHFRQRGTVADSREIVPDYYCGEFERWANLLDRHIAQFSVEDSSYYTERNFYPAFFADLWKASKEIIIVSAFLTGNRAERFFNLFRSKIAQDVEIRIFTRKVREQGGEMSREAEAVIQQLERIGVQVIQRGNIHHKYAFVDRQTAWDGSLNILSRARERNAEPDEHMWRMASPTTCEEIIKLHSFGSDTEVEPGSRRPVQTDRICDVVRNGKTCGSPMVLVRGPHGIFVGCAAYPKCQNHYSIRRGENVGTDATCPGRDGTNCGKPLLAVPGPFGVYLRCSDPNCKGTRNIGR